MSTTKACRSIQIKDADAGTVEAVISTFNVVDKDGDVVLPGAIKNGTPVRISAYGHQSWNGHLPVGKGTVYVERDRAVFKGQFFLDTTMGRDTFTTVKHLAELGEWSYSLHNVKSRRGELNGRPANFLESIDIHEVSPVLQGASVGTRTLVAKSDRTTEWGQAMEELKRAYLHMALREAEDTLRRTGYQAEKL